MKIALQSVSNYGIQDNLIILANPTDWSWANTLLADGETQFAQNAVSQGTKYISLVQNNRFILIEFITAQKNPSSTKETVRRTAAKRVDLLRDMRIKNITLLNVSHENFTYEYTEGLVLGNYQFLKYFGTTTKRNVNTLKTLAVLDNSLSADELAKLDVVLDAVCTTRDWINEPLSHFSAEQMSAAFAKYAEGTDVKVTILHKKEIEELKMGGLLGVNLGSFNPPTFTIMEYKPANAKNKQPIVLVGKGLVYDSGGYSIKPTPDSMDHMKCDMTGAGVVATTICAAAKNKLPLHIIALVPATDNMISDKAFVPGDIITISDGTTVEVLNTDAEGRLVLADALHYAKRYNPELVLDFATLTGAAARAIGQVGCAMFSTTERSVTDSILASGYNVYERAVELPLWDEYGDMIKSEIADIKNTAGPLAGAQTAAKFLQHFTDYPWMHFDIAAMAFLQQEDGYWVKGGTGWGVRFVYDFLSKY